jgi:hypothetical protein
MIKKVAFTNKGSFKNVVMLFYISLQSFAALWQALAHSAQGLVVNFSHSVAHLLHILAHSVQIFTTLALSKIIN